jgi:hypothetical protein
VSSPAGFLRRYVHQERKRPKDAEKTIARNALKH